MSVTLFRSLCLLMSAFLFAAGLLGLSQEISPARALAASFWIDGTYVRPRTQEALASGNPDEMKHAHQRLEEVLQLSPFDSNAWVLLATLRSRIEFGAKGTAQALKLSYLTAPSAAQLMGERLLLGTSTGVIQDPEIQELAKGDLRLIITRRPDLFGVVQSAYRQGSAAGRDFLENATRSIDPAFVPRLKHPAS